MSGSVDSTIKIWNSSTYELITTFTGHTSTVWALTILPNGNIVSRSSDNTIKIWDLTFINLDSSTNAIEISFSVVSLSFFSNYLLGNLRDKRLNVCRSPNYLNKINYFLVFV